jgi:hypothetical protein
MLAEQREETGTAAVGPGGATVDADRLTDRQGLAEMLGRHVPDSVAVQAAVSELLGARWRPPAPVLTTVEELDGCRPGTVVTDRDDHVWVRDAAGDRCEPHPAGVFADELIEWAPLTRHTDGRPESGAGR